MEGLNQEEDGPQLPTSEPKKKRAMSKVDISSNSNSCGKEPLFTNNSCYHEGEDMMDNMSLQSFNSEGSKEETGWSISKSKKSKNKKKGRWWWRSGPIRGCQGRWHLNH